MKKNLSILVLLLLTVTLKAQVPGYMGKKFSAGYDFHFYFGGIDPDARIYDATYNLYQPSIFFNKFHEVHADYVLSKKYSVGLAYQFFKTGQFYAESGNSPGYGYYSASNYLNMSCSSIMVNNKFFFYNNGTALAPIGNYGQIGVGVVTARSVAKVVGSDYSTIAINKFVTHENVNTPIIAFGLGNQSLLFDRLIIDVGVEGAFLPFTIKGWAHDLSNNYSVYGTYPREENARNAILTRMQTFYVSSVKFGVGVLLF